MTYTKEQFELISKYLGEELEDEFLEGISGGRAMNDEEFAHLSKTLQKISSQPVKTLHTKVPASLFLLNH